MEPKSAEKKIERISKLQKQKLVQHMSANLEFARGQFNGVNSNSNYKEMWEALTTTLNSMGGSGKTVEQWKKCWIDLKSGVKKSVNKRRKFMTQTGGGCWADVPRDLNPLEEKILQIITVDAVDGDPRTPESGVELPADNIDVANESVEEFLSVEFLEDDDVYAPPPTKRKSTAPLSMPSSSNAAATSSIPKYKEALQEAKYLHREVMAKLEYVEKQNETILNKLAKIELILENNMK